MSAPVPLALLVAILRLLQATTWLDPAPHRVELVTVADGVQLETLDFGGTGRPIVLLAGLGNTAHVFDDFAPKLTTLGHVYAITRRGYGVSSRPESGYDVARLGEDVLAVIDALRLDKPALIGHSLAGQELSYLAVQHRDRVSALIYLDAAYRYAYDVPGDFEKDFPTLPSPPPTLPAVVRQPPPPPEAERRQPRGLPTAAQAILAGGRQFTGITLPTLAIFASPHDIGAAPDPAFDRFDEAMTERQARAVEHGIPGAKVLRWPHASHFLFLARESDVIKEVAAFLAGLR
jgi:pimeloyl-ACP methyl ester carboxylesterase